MCVYVTGGGGGEGRLLIIECLLSRGKQKSSLGDKTPGAGNEVLMA